MTDTLKRLAGPTRPAQTNAGTLLYTAPGSTTTAVKSALITNSDPVFGAFLTMAIGTDLSVVSGLDDRICSQFYVAPGDTVYMPLDVVLATTEVIHARQSCMVDPTRMVLAAAVAATSNTSATAIATASWTEAVGDQFLMTVALRDTSAAAVISSFTDTHAGVTWTLLQGPVTNAAGTAKVYQYTAESTDTTAATTTVTFDSTCDTSSISIVKLTALTSYDDDSSGTNGETAFRALGTTEAPSGVTPLISAGETGASVIYGLHHPTASETQTAMTGWTEIDDVSTNSGTLSTAYMMAPASWARPTISIGTTAYQGFFAEILNSKRSLTVTLNGVEVT